MKRMRLRTKLMFGMLVILCVSVGLVASQAVLLFREDKSAYVFELNASQAIRVADEVHSSSTAIRLPLVATFGMPEASTVAITLIALGSLKMSIASWGNSAMTDLLFWCRGAESNC